MKKSILIFICIFLCMTSCSAPSDKETSANDTTVSETTETTATTEEETTKSAEEITTATSYDTGFYEQMYGDVQKNPTNLELSMESDRYPLDTKSIGFHVINRDNRNFVLDWNVKFEYYDGNKWIKLSYKDPCYAENNNKSGTILAHKQPEGSFAKSWESIAFDDYDFTFVAGKYRITKTVGSVTMTREFELY